MSSTGRQLYTIDSSIGAPSAVGSGLGTEVLTRFPDETRLFGIDTNATPGVGMEEFDRKTEAALIDPTDERLSG